MQEELAVEYPDTPIQLVGINQFGHESGNPQMTDDSTTPVLQDVDANNNDISDVWYDLLDITYRDVKILNGQNEVAATVNLTPPAGYDLREEANYDALKQIMADVAQQRPFWQNPNEPTDVNGDERTSAVDALQCINELMLGNISESDITLPIPMPPLRPSPYLDVNGDGLITASDPLRVINRLMEQSNSPEGEFITGQADSRESEHAPLAAESDWQGEFVGATSHSNLGNLPSDNAGSLQNPSEIPKDSTANNSLGITAQVGKDWSADVHSENAINQTPNDSTEDLNSLSEVAVDDFFQSDLDFFDAHSLANPFA